MQVFKPAKISILAYKMDSNAEQSDNNGVLLWCMCWNVEWLTGQNYSNQIGQCFPLCLIHPDIP